jgi:hypothetical protein
MIQSPQQLDERDDALHVRLVDDVLAAQFPFLFTVFVGQNVASTHVVPLQLAGTGFAKPFSCTLFCFRFRHGNTFVF